MKKLLLDELRVQSFVTNLEDREQDMHRGGNSNRATCEHCTPPQYPTDRNCETLMPLTDCISLEP
jgi:hypothetical protein